MSVHELPPHIPADLKSFEDLERSLEVKGTSKPCDGLYPRDGVADVAHIESQLCEVTTPGQENVIAWASGMSAVRETVLFATEIKSERKSPAKIMYAQELYSQSTSFFNKLAKIGVNVEGFDSGDEKKAEEILKEGSADVIFAETVANTPSMPVLNVHKLLEGIRSLDNPPIVVLDNTLPLKTGLDIPSLLMPDDKVIVVESGTKNAMNNSEMFGVSHSPNTELMDSLRKHKAHSGAVNSINALPAISETLSATLPGFHERNRKVFGITHKIAEALLAARLELGADSDFEVTFPTFKAHDNYEYSKSITPEQFGFISPVVFITAADFSEDGAPKLMKRIVEHPRMREQTEEGQVYQGQSFGTKKCKVLYDRNAPNVRFTGGYDVEDPEALAAAVKVALADI